MELTSDAASMQQTLDDLNLIGRRILSFDIVGRMSYFDHQSMLNIYNNFIASEGGPHRKPGSVIRESEIPLDLELTRTVHTNGPRIMKLDDGCFLEILIPDFGCAGASTTREDNYGKNELVNASLIMKPILGERISAIQVVEMRADSQERLYVSPASEHPIRHIRIDCETHSLYFSFTDTAVMNNVKKLDPLGITMRELKEALSYYGELFD